MLTLSSLKSDEIARIKVEGLGDDICIRRPSIGQIMRWQEKAKTSAEMSLAVVCAYWCDDKGAPIISTDAQWEELMDAPFDAISAIANAITTHKFASFKQAHEEAEKNLETLQGD
jgi:hypothetical protein